MHMATADLLLSIFNLQADRTPQIPPSVVTTHLMQVHALGIVCVIA
jgi:hypothetical protein